MKMLSVALIAGAVAAGSIAPAFANNQSGVDSQTERGRLESLWILTGDPTYARALHQLDQSGDRSQSYE
jgi:hypothetical protein